MTPPAAQSALELPLAVGAAAPGTADQSGLRLLRSRGRVRGAAALLGPAFVAAVAYIDPGNFATNFSAGAAFGYALAWVIVAANLMAMLVQYLSAKVGVRVMARHDEDRVQRLVVEHGLGRGRGGREAEAALRVDRG